MKIFCDIDGVLRDLHKTMGIEYSNHWYDEKFMKTFTEWKTFKPKELFGKNANKFSDMAFCILNSEIYMQGELVFLTGSPADCSEYTEAFLQQIGFVDPEIIHVDSMEDKLQYLMDNPDSILIDDYPYFWKNKAFKKVSKRIFLRIQPWNHKYMYKYDKWVAVEERNAVFVKISGFQIHKMSLFHYLVNVLRSG